MLPPFPMWPAFPASEYYGGSATTRRNSGRCACPPTSRLLAGMGNVGSLPTFTVDRFTGSASSFTPTASPGPQIAGLDRASNHPWDIGNPRGGAIGYGSLQRRSTAHPLELADR